VALFKKDPKYTKVTVSKKKDIPGGLWVKCEECGELLYRKTLEENLRVCPKCNYHFTLGARERIAQVIDEGTFVEMSRDMESEDPLNFKGPKTYKDKVKSDQGKTGLKEAAVTGIGKIDGVNTAIGVTDSRFIMGSMGSVVGEKLTRLIEYSADKDLPLVIISGSGGGARMYEGMFSLMQMAKTSAALAKHNEKGGLFLSILTNPTMAGVLESFASLGDIIIAEPKALIGFTGPRVIEQTIRQKLPPGFQKSEFLLEHGLIDLIVNRKALRETVSCLVSHLKKSQHR